MQQIYTTYLIHKTDCSVQLRQQQNLAIDVLAYAIFPLSITKLKENKEEEIYKFCYKIKDNRRRHKSIYYNHKNSTEGLVADIDWPGI